METRKLSEMAIFIAVATVLELISTVIPFAHMPQGGSVSLSMLPIFIIAYRHGLKDGLIAGFIFGIINFMLAGFFIHWGSIIFDYSLAFTVLGLAGIFHRKAFRSPIYFAAGILLGGFARYVVHSFSGVIFWSEYAPEGMGVYYYSFIFYNLPYMSISISLCLVIGLILRNRVPYFERA